ncbi:hypothetical protein PAT3040_01907 [Paenibacillus agaridevorans]|uniref:Uncharacterized protein n=1 Tax=Paenibacillus agaridevorans TaxID=171404 RepID=A0A2R5ENX6_9BACL|nr:hypothetical protein [Paenibacillus agaridevorans]GBG07359.1 hypothetical protein PAT3040_01907 [Paenibacillus agaridevorans]
MVSRIYDDKLAAAEGLLGEVAEILNESKIRYVVLGGWIPYLFNSSDEYPHPGTYDVDIEVESGRFVDNALLHF